MSPVDLRCRRCAAAVEHGDAFCSTCGTAEPQPLPEWETAVPAHDSVDPAYGDGEAGEQRLPASPSHRRTVVAAYGAMVVAFLAVVVTLVVTNGPWTGEGATAPAADQAGGSAPAGDADGTSTAGDGGAGGSTGSGGQLLGDVGFHFGGASAFYDLDQTLTVLSPAPSMTWAMEWEQADGGGAGALAIRTDEAGRGTAEFTVTGARDVVGQACSYDESTAVAVCDVPVDVEEDSAFRLRVWTITVDGRQALGAFVQPADGDEVSLGAAVPSGDNWLGREAEVGGATRVIRDTVSFGEDAGCASVRRSAVLWGVPGADGDDRTERYQHEGRLSGQPLGGACVDADPVGDDFYAGSGVAMTVIGR